MPYNKKTELPKGVQGLPSQAQEIYMKAYNNAWEQYKNPKDRRGNESREEVAHKVAWSAVENSYEKDSKGNWKKKK
ncbi:MAG: ChaB family protein [Nanoarchaeota archaeon]